MCRMAKERHDSGTTHFLNGQFLLQCIFQVKQFKTELFNLFVLVIREQFVCIQFFGIRQELRCKECAVNVLGKVIVRDNGECVPGQFCEPVVGTKDKEFVGTAKPAEKDSKLPKFYVLERLSSNSILILNNSLTNIYNPMK